MKIKPEYFLYYFILGVTLNIFAPDMTGTFKEPTKVGIIINLTAIPSLIAYFFTRKRKKGSDVNKTKD